MKNKYEISIDQDDNDCECWCIADDKFILYCNWENVYESYSKADCLEWIINREGIDLIDS